MPAGRRLQSNSMLYTLITFVGLFLIATTFAIIYYVKSENHRTKAATLQSQINELATSTELRKIGAIVGAKQGRKSRLGTMVDYLDTMTSLIIGGLPEETSAEVKVNTVSRKVREILEPLTQNNIVSENDDPNTTGLIRIIEKLNAKLEDTTGEKIAVQQQLKELQNRFDDAMAVSSQKEQTLLAEKEKYQQQVEEITQNYERLKALMEQTAEQS